MSTLSCTIRGNPVSILADPSGSTTGGAATGMSGGSASTTIPTITAALEVRDVLKLTVIDASGTAVYYRGDPVVLTDSVSGVLYSGFVQTSDPTKLSPDPASTTTFHTITCMDKQYLFDKRTNNQPYLNMYAGDIAADLVRRIGSQEGVTMAAAMDRDTVQADFAAGTLTGTVATANVGDGDLEMTAAGSSVTITETTTANFAAGTLTNVTATNNTLVPTTQSAIALQCTLATSYGADTCSVQIWSGSVVVGTSDTLNYSVWVSGTSPQITMSVDILFSDGTYLRSSTLSTDAHGLPPSPASDLTYYAKNQWYTRTVSLASGLTGKTVTNVMVACGGTSTGAYTGYFKNIYLGSASGSPFFSPSATVPNVNPPAIVQAVTTATYPLYLISCSVVQSFDPASVSRISTASSIDAVKLLRQSTVIWNAITPGGSTIALFASYDGGASYQLCVNNSALPGLPAGSNVTGLSVTLKETFTTTVSPADLPTLSDVTISLLSAASPISPKSDIVTKYITQANWNTGTFSNATATASGDLTVTSIARNWDDGVYSNQTYWGSASSQGVSGGKFFLTVNSSRGASTFVFAGQVADFIADIDITASANAAMATYFTYRAPTAITTGYYLLISTDGTLHLYNPAATDIGSAPFAWTPGQTYHVRLDVRGSKHTIYMGGSATPILSVTDANVLAAGYFGVEAFLGSGSSTVYFDNFTYSTLITSTWQSPSVSLTSLGTCGLSAIGWTEINTGKNSLASSLLVSTSVDGGSTYQLCTNGSGIANLPSGTNVSGKTLIVKITLLSIYEPSAPLVRQLVWRVLGAYPGATGTRVNPVLSLSPAVRAGSTSVSWDATLPTGTSLVVATSPDNITYTPIAASGNPIASIYAQPAPQIDVFTTNTLANYTNTFKSGGSVATVTYTTASSRLTLAGGSGAVYLFTAISRADVDLICDMDASDAGGLVWRYVNNLNYYELGIYDDSSSGGFTSQARLYKVSAGVRSLLGSASPIVFPRGTPGQSPYSRVHVTMAGAVITVYFEGVQVQTYTDGSPLAAGQMGLRNDGGTSRYYQLRLQPLGDSMVGQNLYIKETMTTSDPAQMPQLLDLTASVRGPGLATGALIPQLHAPTVPIAEFLNTEMNTITTASGDCYWNIDKAGALTLAMRNAVPAPWCLFSTDLIYEANVTPTSTSDLYRNRQNITNCTGVTALLHEQMVADGSASSWKTLNPIYSAPAISVQGNAQTVGVQSVDTGKQFYWTSNSTSFGQDAAAVKLPIGFIIDIWYVGQFITTVTVDNAAEQTARAAVEVGTSGIVEASENGQGMLASAATVYAQGLLARYGLNNAVQMVGATSRPGLAPGMLLPVFLPEHQLGNAQMLVTGVNTTMQQQADGSVLYFYQITATQGSNLANWTKVFGF